MPDDTHFCFPTESGICIQLIETVDDLLELYAFNCVFRGPRVASKVFFERVKLRIRDKHNAVAAYRVVDDRRGERYVQFAIAHEVYQAAVGLGSEDTVHLPLPSFHKTFDLRLGGQRTKRDRSEGVGKCSEGNRRIVSPQRVAHKMI